MRHILLRVTVLNLISSQLQSNRQSYFWCSLISDKSKISSAHPALAPPLSFYPPPPSCCSSRRGRNCNSWTCVKNLLRGLEFGQRWLWDGRWEALGSMLSGYAKVTDVEDLIFKNDAWIQTVNLAHCRQASHGAKPVYSHLLHVRACIGLTAYLISGLVRFIFGSHCCSLVY